jgi:hypothetical protein
VSQDISTWQEVALIAGPAIAAIAALASWASVWQARKLGRESSAPLLQVQKTVNAQGFVGAVVTNAGGGPARGAGIYIVHPPYYASDSLGHGFLFPGDTRVVVTGIQVAEAETDIIVFCRDRNSVPHFWNADEEHRELTDWRGRPKYFGDLDAAFGIFHPDVGLSDLTPAVVTVTDA